jgi:hypothetical protein
MAAKARGFSGKSAFLEGVAAERPSLASLASRTLRIAGRSFSGRETWHISELEVRLLKLRNEVETGVTRQIRLRDKT